VKIEALGSEVVLTMTRRETMALAELVGMLGGSGHPLDSLFERLEKALGAPDDARYSAWRERTRRKLRVFRKRSSTTLA